MVLNLSFDGLCARASADMLLRGNPLEIFTQFLRGVVFILQLQFDFVHQAR
jgi:hypothetical protein